MTESDEFDREAFYSAVIANMCKVCEDVMCDKLCEFFRDYDQLKAENARLKAALQAIADKGPSSPGDKKAEMAKEALGGKVADIGRTE